MVPIVSPRGRLRELGRESAMRAADRQRLHLRLERRDVRGQAGELRGDGLVVLGLVLRELEKRRGDERRQLQLSNRIACLVELLQPRGELAR